MATITDFTLEYGERICGKHVVAGCEPGTFVFEGEDEGCEDCGSNSFFTLDEVPTCPTGAGPFFVTVLAGCTEMAYYSLEDLIDELAGADVYAKVDADDASSGYLFDKIKACEDNNYITVAIDNSGDNHFLRICLDGEALFNDMSIEDIGDWPEPGECEAEQTGIDMGDESECPVCEAEGCIKQYLTYCGGTYSRECDSCGTAILRKPRALASLLGTVSFTQNTGLENLYYISNDSIATLDAAGRGQLADSSYGLIKRHCIDISNDYIKINMPGDYLVGYNGSIQITKGVHAFRIGIALVRGALFSPIVQDKRSGTDDAQYSGFTSASGTIPFGIYGDNTTTIAESLGPTQQFSVGRVIEEFALGSSMRIHLLAGDIIVPFIRVSTVMTGDDEAATTAQISIVGASEASTGFPQAFFYEVFNLDDECDRKYWNKKYGITGCS